ncbi:MAG: helix-turn-helix domain-containing protein [Planctomycetes bacterium]|nr:helix-turn-helix domain-containing protein [Planctomycetota bacterium]
MPYPHQFIKLTAEEQKRLLAESQRLFMTGQYSKQRPLKALYLSDKRKTYKDIANELKVDYRSVKRWISDYRKGGLDAFIRKGPYQRRTSMKENK